MNNVKKVCRLALLCLSVSTLVACSSLSEKTSSSSSDNQTEASSNSSEKKGLFAKAKINLVQVTLIHKMSVMRQLNLSKPMKII